MRHRSTAILALVSLCLLFGCQPAEQIQTYKVPKEATPPVVAAVAEKPTEQPAEPTDRMLAAILPAGDRAWFFKVTGPIADFDQRAEAIADFFTSIKVGQGATRPEWQLPDGWSEQAGTGMRAATILIPAGDKPLEMSVIGLPWRGAPGELLSNINRWRGQMSLPEVDEKGLAEFTRQTKVGDSTMTIVDLRGRFSAGNMAAPFAGGGPFSGRAPRAPGNTSPASPSGRDSETSRGEGLPTGHPPLNAEGASRAVPLTFKAPDSWQSIPASGMRKAAFRLQDGQQEALVTVIDFPADAGPMMADPLENVNRWRREVGLEAITRDALDGAVEQIDVGGHPGQYTEMIPDAAKPAESQAYRATLGAIVPVGDRIWFIKLTGDHDLVAGQREKFKSFLESIRFTADDGT